MALIVEDGSGITNSESYASVAEADLYFANRNNTDWGDLDVPVKEANLRLATDYMTETYRGRWKGYRSNTYQALDWPRKSVVLTDMAINYMIQYNVLPKEVKVACIELAMRANAGELAPDLSQGIISESVGTLSTTYDRSSPQQTRYRAIDMLLRPLLMSSGASVPLVRT
jgi:hypothetical protein